MKFADRPEWELYGKCIRGEILEPGARVGRFGILNLLNLTLFGALYHARDRNSGETVSLHLFPSGLRQDAHLRDALRSLVARLGTVPEPGVLAAREVLELPGHLGVVCSEVPGARTLTRYFEDVSPAKGLPPGEVRQLLDQAARAVEAACDAGVLHCTLMPENVLIDPDGAIRIHCFGFMQALDRHCFESFVSSAIVPVTREANAPGYSSLEVMSPELRNQEQIDVRADIHGLGMLGYYLLTHLRPAASELVLSSLADELPERWAALIACCLQRDPAQRFQTIKAYRKALLEVEEAAVSPRHRTQQNARRDRFSSVHRKRILGLAGLGIAVMVTAVGSFWFTSASEKNAPEAQASMSPGEPEVDKEQEPALPFGKLRVHGPSEARIYVLGTDGDRLYVDEIPESGEWAADHRLLVGDHDLLVSKRGFQNQSFGSVKLGGEEWTELNAALEPLPTTLRVVSEPPGASVHIAGETMGETPLVITSVTPGEIVSVSVAGDGWRSVERSIGIEAGEENLVDFGVLETATGQLTIELRLQDRAPTAGELEQLTVSIDGATIESATKIGQRLTAGRHTIRIAHPDYHSRTLEIDLGDGETLVETVDLAPKPALLDLVLPQRPHRVFVDGEPAGSGERGIELPAEKKVEVLVAVKDFYSVRRSFFMRANETEVWEPSLRALAGPEAGENWTVPYLGLVMIWVEPGEVRMGSPPREQLRLPNEGPFTRVRLTRGFWVGSTEVSQEAYRQVMRDNPSEFRGDERPVESVSWYQATEFCEKLTAGEQRANRLPEGYVYRLPTEAEWEYFARAGTRTAFSFGETTTPEDGNFQGRYPLDYSSAPVEGSEHFETVPVGSYSPNPWGLHDIHGNVREWVFDRYNDRLADGRQTDFVRMEGRGRGFRGGGWEDPAHRARSSARTRLSADSARPSLGFRVVLAPVPGRSE